MLRYGLRCIGLPALAAAALLWAAGMGLAQHGGGHGGGGGHAGGGGHYGGSGGGHYYGGSGGGHHLGGYGGYGGYHHHGFYGGGLYLGWYPGYYGYGLGYYGGGYYPGAYQSFYYPDADAYPEAPYPLTPSLAAPGLPFASLGNAAAPPAPGAPGGPGTAVNFSVQAPANAEIWIEGQKTSQTGDVRQFQSPPLSPGMDYQYQIRARWTDGGTVVDQTRTMRVRAGDQFTVSFGKPAAPPSGVPAAPRRP